MRHKLLLKSCDYSDIVILVNIEFARHLPKSLPCSCVGFVYFCVCVVPFRHHTLALTSGCAPQNKPMHLPCPYLKKMLHIQYYLCFKNT